MKISTTLTLYTEIPHGVFETIGTNTREVFADVVDVGMNEYYLARSAGLAPEIAFELPEYSDYQGEKMVKWDNTMFRIVRTTRRGMHERLICERVDVNADGSVLPSED